MSDPQRTLQLILKTDTNPTTYAIETMVSSRVESVVFLDFGMPDPLRLAKACMVGDLTPIDAPQVCRLVMSVEALRRCQAEIQSLLDNIDKQNAQAQAQMPIIVIERKGEPS